MTPALRNSTSRRDSFPWNFCVAGLIVFRSDRSRTNGSNEPFDCLWVSMIVSMAL